MSRDAATLTGLQDSGPPRTKLFVTGLTVSAGSGQADNLIIHRRYLQKQFIGPGPVTGS